ncbi:DUF4157 domain-containing protein [Pseudorhodoferax sp.]|uniref:DUF4157 domain-containing protein n=1 Tax=Pseudorhodoferax sp. TaxID=1993553 RepID=UPI0039E6A0BF
MAQRSLASHSRVPTPTAAQRTPTTAGAAHAAHPVAALQRSVGNRAVQGLTDGQAFGSLLAQRRGAGSPLAASARAFLEARLQADLGAVHVHTDSQADAMAAAVQARSFTHGSDLYFRAGAYDPHSDSGLRLLAHEITHVLQQAEGPVSATPVGDGIALSDPGDAFEREADRVADAVMDMQGAEAVPLVDASTAVVNAGGAAAVQRSEDDDSWFGRLSGLADSARSVVKMDPDAAATLLDGARTLVGNAGTMASEAWHGATDLASDAWEGAGGLAHDAVAGTSNLVHGVWNGASGLADEAVAGVTGYASGKYAEMKQAAGYVKQGEQLLDHGIDWLGGKAKEGTRWAAGHAEGIPVLEQIAGAGESAVNQYVDFESGIAKGAGTMLGGVLGAVANPVDTVSGLWTMSEHIPGLGMPQKLLHGAYDLAFSDKGLGTIADQTFNPSHDGAYWGNVASTLWQPYQKAIAEGRPMEALGRGVFDIGSLFIGTGEAGAAAKAGSVAKAGEVADVARAAGAADAAKAAGVADAAKAAELAEASRGIKPSLLPDAPNPFAPTELPPGLQPTEFPPDFLTKPKFPKPPKLPEIPEPPPGGFPKPPVGRAPEMLAPSTGAPELTGMRQQHIGTPTGDLAALTDAEIDAFVNGIGTEARSSTLFELPGQNPVTGSGLQDIVERINPNPNGINYSVNHYFSDVGEVRIANGADVPLGPRAPVESLIPPGTGVTADAVPQTALHHADGSPVLNTASDPIGPSNVELRYHSANPRHPTQGPTVQVNTPSDRFGWQGDRNIHVTGDQHRYLLPDGSWKTIREMTTAERAQAHWSTGR